MYHLILSITIITTNTISITIPNYYYYYCTIITTTTNNNNNNNNNNIFLINRIY